MTNKKQPNILYHILTVESVTPNEGTLKKGKRN